MKYKYENKIRNIITPIQEFKAKTRSFAMESLKVLDDDTALLAIKEGGRQKIKKVWSDFKDFVVEPHDWELQVPAEDQVLEFFRHLRNVRKIASSSLWTFYTNLNSMTRNKYGFNLKEYVRVKSLIKSYQTDIKHKASIFSKEDLDCFLLDPSITTPYWGVRKALSVAAYFGGLRRIEVEALKLEDIDCQEKGVYVTVRRAKQREDQLSTDFLIPRRNSGVNYAEIFEVYLHGIKERLGVRTGRVWYTGRHDIYVNVPMGKNYITRIPHEIAEKLGSDNVSDYTFHSFRRTAATNIADQGATALQMQQHFGWKSASMAMEYISKSKVHVNDCGKKLAGGGDGSRQSVIQPVPGPSGVRSVSSNEPQSQKPDVSFQGADRTYNFYNCSGFTIN